MQPVWLLLLLLPLSVASLEHYGDQFDELDLSHESPDKHQEILDNAKKMGHCFSKKRKSPIDIDLNDVTITDFPPLIFKDYSVSENVSQNLASNFTSTIHGYSNWTKKPFLSGGPLTGEYHLMTVQWDTYSTTLGNFHEVFGPYQHTVNGGRHNFELHLIHTKNGMSIEEAKLVPGGIVIVAISINHVFRNTNGTKLITTPAISAVINDYLRNKSLAQEQPSIMNDEETQFLNVSARKNTTEFKWLSPETFLPEERDSYFVYNGTFIHPPCTNDVTWIILTNPSHLHIRHQNIFYAAASNGESITFRLMEMKKNKRAKVLLHLANSFSTPVSLNCSSKASFALGVLTAVVCGVVVVLITFYLSQKCNKKTVDEEKDRHPIANYNIGIDNINFTQT